MRSRLSRSSGGLESFQVSSVDRAPVAAIGIIAHIRVDLSVAWHFVNRVQRISLSVGDDSVFKATAFRPRNVFVLGQLTRLVSSLVVRESSDSFRVCTSTRDIGSLKVANTRDGVRQSLWLGPMHRSVLVVDLGRSLLDEVTLSNLITNLVLGFQRVRASLALPILGIDILIALRVIRNSSGLHWLRFGTLDVVDFHEVLFWASYGFLRTGTLNIIVLNRVTDELGRLRLHILE